MPPSSTVAPWIAVRSELRRLSISGSSGTGELYTRLMDGSLEQGAFATTEDALWANEAIRRVRSEVHRVIVGQDRVLDEILLSMLC